jgi:cathepsin L
VEVRADTTSFQEYAAGILDDPNCSGDVLNHVLLLVGYGTENGKDYWIARNRL